MDISDGRLESHLRTALREADDDTARYHIREALQLRFVERTGGSDHP